MAPDKALEHRKVVDETIAMLDEYDRQMEALAEKYIGKIALQHGRSLSDLWFRREWYLNRIFELGLRAGANQQRMRRCKRTDTKTWLRYSNAEQECRQVVQHLMLEVLLLK